MKVKQIMLKSNKYKRFYIQNYGCQMNVYDSRVIAQILSENGYRETADEKNADVIIVNTCSVREHAEQRAIGRIGELQKLREENPNLLIGVVGCMAQNLGNSIKGADFIVGPSNYRKLPEIIVQSLESRVQSSEKKLTTHNSQSCIEQTDELYSDVFPQPNIWLKQGLQPTRCYGITAFVSVMRGCDNFCSYCIVPYVRGHARSRPSNDISKEIELLASKGIRKITLLGQSVNEYSYNGVSFPHLLRLVDGTGIPWINFTTSHPKNMSQELIDVMREGEKICEWLHLPMQSGANEILKKMGRGYTKEEYLDWVYKTRKSIPEVSITTDILVGFPGESEKNFNETLEVIKEVRFDSAYMFKYSERPYTKAYNMQPKVPEEVRIERLEELINIQNKITREKNSELIGTTQEVLVLGKSKRGNSLYGRTRQNKVVLFNGKASPGDFVKVKIKELRGWTPYGELLSSQKRTTN